MNAAAREIASIAVTAGLVAMLAGCQRGTPSPRGTPEVAAQRPAAHRDAPTAMNGEATASGEHQAGSDKGRGGSSDGTEKAERSAVPVRTATVRLGTIPEIVTAYGTVSGGANSQASLAFPESGRIASIDVTVGERVQARQVLARLDTRAFEADVAQAAANLRAAQANARRTTLGARPQQVAQTGAQIEQARTQLAIAQAQLERQQKLLALGIAARADVDAAKGAVATARSQLRVLQEQRATQLHPWQPDAEAASAGVAQAQAALAGAQQKIALARIVAPFSGVVIARLHNDGESVEAAAPVVQIANDRAPVFTAQFAPLDAARIHRGELATVRPQGVSGASATGRVVAINPAQGDAHSVPVLIRLAAASSAFGPGAYGEASVRVGTRRGLVVPTAAVVADAATGSVQIFRREGEHYTPVPVTIVATVGQRTIVSGPGLRPGTAVAGEGAAELATPQQAPKADND
jgi:multidrug resistance efflux pump